MKIKSILVVFITFVTLQTSNAQNETKSTQQILNSAFNQAKKENKNVFVKFEASWCGWCKKMDAKMNQPAIKNSFNDNYVIEHLVVLEQKNKKHLENTGSEDLLNKYGGERQGIPFFLIFDADGNLLADSKMVKDKDILKGEGSNIGCPGTDDEIDAFIYKIKETSNLNNEELKKIAEVFQSSN